MKKIIFLLVVAIMLVFGCIASAGVSFPQSLTVIEGESFMGDTNLTGLLTLHDQIEQIGDNAFSQTNLFALQIQGNAVNVGDQNLNHAVYIRAYGQNTAFTNVSGIKYMIGPDNSTARIFARMKAIPFVAEEHLVEYDGFYYQRTDSGLMLLSAVDGTILDETITIPNRIDRMNVTNLSAFAFYGCNRVETIHLPETLRNDKNIEAALEDCANTEIVYDHVGLIIRSISSNTSSGAVGDNIIWTIDVLSDAPVQSFLYTLEKDGETIDILQSNAATYSRVITAPGAYSLGVEVTDTNGNKGSGNSPKLYIAVESMVLTVPETLNNGEDLEVQFEEVENAVRYSIYLTNDITGELIDYHVLHEAGGAVFSGCMLEEGTWRVTGYVYGNDFQYSVPTVKKITVYGVKAQGPAIPAQEPIFYDRQSKGLKLSDTDSYAFKYRFRYSDGTLSKEYCIVCSTDTPFYIGVSGEYEQWQQGGAILLRGAVKQNGMWTDWGETTEIKVLPTPKLETPVLSAPENAQAGKDLTVTFTSVEHGNYYNLSIVEGYEPDQTKWRENYDNEVFFQQYRHGSTVVIPGYYLSTGVYTLRLYVWNDDGYYRSDWTGQKLTITGERPAAPVLISDKTEQRVKNDPLTLSVHAPGAEEAYIFCESWNSVRKTSQWEAWGVSLDEDGNGSLKKDWNFSGEEDWTGQIFHYRVTANIDGKWSEFSEDVTVLMTASDPFPSPIINVPENLQAGQDFTFSFSSMEGAEYYTANIRNSFGYETIYHWNNTECLPDQTLTVPGYILTRGKYYLTVQVYLKSEPVSKTEQVFSVAGTRPDAPSIIEYPAEAHIKDNAIFVVSTEGAEKLVVEYGQQNYGVNRRIIDTTDNTTSWSYKFSENSKDTLFTFRFAVLKNGIWSRWQAIDLEVQDLPPLDLTVIHADDTVEAGTDFLITFDPVEYASDYQYSLFKGSEQIKYRTTAPSSRQIVLYGYDLEPDEYTLKIYASSDDHATSESVKKFTVIGNKANAPGVSVNKTEVMTEERFKFTIDTSEADALIAEQNARYSEYSSKSYRSIDVQGESTKWETYNYSAANVDYRFAVLIDGKWSAWSTAKTITVRQKPTLAEPVVQVTQTTTAGNDLSFRFSSVENATSYSASFSSLYGGDTLYRFDSNTALPETDLTIPGYLINSGIYVISVSASASEYSSSTNTSYIKATGQRPAPPEVAVEEPLRAKSTATFSINTENAEELQVKYQFKAESNWWPEQRQSIPVTGDLTNWSLNIDQYKQGVNLIISFAVRENGTWSSWRTNTYMIEGQLPAE